MSRRRKTTPPPRPTTAPDMPYHRFLVFGMTEVEVFGGGGTRKQYSLLSARPKNTREEAMQHGRNYYLEPNIRIFRLEPDE